VCRHREVELRPGGRDEPVTWANRLEYATLVEQHRLTESKKQVCLNDGCLLLVLLACVTTGALHTEYACTSACTNLLFFAVHSTTKTTAVTQY
jgi:hypothetical protein